MRDLSLLLKTARRGTKFWSGLLTLVLGLLLGQALAALPPGATSSKLTAQQAERLLALERGWVANAGQWDKRATFSAPGYFGTTWITKDGELLHVAVKKEECKDKTPKAQTCPSKSWVISERWVGGKVPAIKGEEELKTKVSYFVGNDPSKHRSGLSTYRYASLGEVWSGVEVKLKATQKTVEKLFYVKPGVDPSKIQVQVDGAKGLKLSKDGEVIIQTGLGDLKLSKPVAWQEKVGKKLPVEVSYKLIGKNRYSFVVAKADPNLPLVIDPILQSTYLGGNDNEEAHALAISSAGDVYVAGSTWSTNFPNTTGGAQTSCNNCGGSLPLPDAFVAKLNSGLTQILQSTYLGGSGNDRVFALAISSAGDVYVAGSTQSTNFPNTTGGAQASCSSCGGSLPLPDAFVARLSADLTSNPQSTYLGGSADDEAFALAISSAGNVYVAGYTWSINFPNTINGAQATIHGIYRDAFVAKLNSGLTQIFKSTYLGGEGHDEAFALAISSAGDVYVAGWTQSTDFPHTAGGAQASFGGGVDDAFVARLSAGLGSTEEGECQVPPQLAGEVVYVPLVEVGGQEYSAKLGLVSGRPLLELISVESVSPLLPAECRDRRTTLTGDRVHIPLAVYGGHSYAGELRMFEENGRLLFEVVSARPLD
jgi:hypothetical protein